MVTALEQMSRLDLFLDGSNGSRIDTEKYQSKVARYERLGIRLFSVANCLLSFGGLAERFGRSEQSIVMREANFCDVLGFCEEIDAFDPLKSQGVWSQHSSVTSAPQIRFCARHPVADANNQIVACLYLIDYAEREFDDESRLLLADLAMMVERELIMGLLRQQQNEMLKQIRQLKRDALLDPVLGMWNRAAITRSLSIELERCQKAEKPASLLLISVDQYREIREKYGVTVADAFLLKVVSRMRSCIRPFDALGRFEADAFLVVLPGASNLVSAAVAERIRLSIVVRPESLDEISIAISVCIGIASSSLFPQVSAESLINHAEKASAKARANEQNKIIQATPESGASPS